MRYTRREIRGRAFGDGRFALVGAPRIWSCIGFTGNHDSVATLPTVAIATPPRLSSGRLRTGRCPC